MHGCFNLKFLDRLRVARNILRWGSPYRPNVAVKSMPFSLPTWNLNREILPLVDYLSYASEGYAKNSVVYSCIRKIATTAPAASLRVEKIVDGQRESVDSNVTTFFQSPNPYLNAFTFQETIHTFLNLIGECFLIRAGNELWFGRPDRMYPVPLERKLAGYVYISADGRRTPFLPDEVIFIKYPNPLDEFEGLGRGLSPLSSAAIEADVDNNSTAFMKEFFNNACVPFGLLKSKHILDDADVVRIRQRMKEQYGSAAKISGHVTAQQQNWNGWKYGSASSRRWHELMILDADMEYQKMGLAPQEIALPEVRMLTESRICAVFDVPPILVGVQVGLKNTGAFSDVAIKEARRQLWFDKIIPDNQRIAEVFTNFFRDVLGENEVIAHDYSQVAILQEDRTARFARANQGYQGGWLTQNEARMEAGFKAVDDGDNFKVDQKPVELIKWKESSSNGHFRDIPSRLTLSPEL